MRRPLLTSRLPGELCFLKSYDLFKEWESPARLPCLDRFEVVGTPVKVYVNQAFLRKIHGKLSSTIGILVFLNEFNTKIDINFLVNCPSKQFVRHIGVYALSSLILADLDETAL